MNRTLSFVLVLAAAAVVATAGSAGSNTRSGALHVTKECSQYTGQAGSFCTITSSNLRAIDAGSKVYYAQAADAAGLDGDLVVVAGPGSAAFGHVTLSWATLSGAIAFSGGTGRFKHFEAHVAVTYDASADRWHWDGTYSFDGPHDDD
jgi:hypothetical protein